MTKCFFYFASKCSDLFVTCAYQDIRVFNKINQHELLRINIPNMTCYCIDILRDGAAIISGNGNCSLT